VSAALCEPFEFGDDPTALYRLYDVGGVLLYVGITVSPAIRMGEHATTQQWWPEVARRTMVWYPDRENASEAEETAIWEEKPRYNIMLSSTRASARLSRRQLADRLREDILSELAAAHETGETISVGNFTRMKFTPGNRISISN
jgi:hypothetical protein